MRARRYRQNHGAFLETSSELYFFAGAMAVLDCFRDPAAKALCDEWLRDVVARRSPTNQSPEAQAARDRERQAADASKEFMTRLDAESAATLRDLESELSR